MNTLLLALHLLMTDTSHLSFPPFLQPKFPDVLGKVAIKVTDQYRDSVVKAIRVNYFTDDFNQIIQSYSATKKFVENFYFIHLNNDKFPDVIYDGPSGGEGDMVIIFINRQFTIEKVFTGMQHIIDLKFEKNGLSSLGIYDPGCCAETVEIEKYYEVDAKFHFKQIKQQAALSGMKTYDEDEAGAVLFEKPVPFITLNADYALRYSPEISDLKPDIFESVGEIVKGNIIAQYPKGAKGIAWGYKKDITGREWWLVEMEPQRKLSFNKFWGNEEFPTSYCGWMSSRFVERLP